MKFKIVLERMQPKNMTSIFVSGNTFQKHRSKIRVKQSHTLHATYILGKSITCKASTFPTTHAC